MKKIVALAKLILSTLLSFSKQIFTAIKDAAIPEIEKCEYYSNALGLYVKLEEAFTRERRSKFSKEIRAADKKRDTLYKGIKHRIRGFMLSLVEAEQSAALLIWRIIERNGVDLERMKYNDESSHLNKVLAEVKTPEGEAALKLLGLTEAFAMLATAQQEFETLYQSRGVDDTDRKAFESASALRCRFEDAMEQLIRYAESQAMVNPASKWVQVYNQIVTFSDKIELDLKQSEGRAEAKKKEQKPADPNHPNLSELL